MAMTHTQALSKLAADTLVQTLEEGMARVMARARLRWAGTMPLSRPTTAASPAAPAAALEPCCRPVTPRQRPLYRHKTALALAIVLHRTAWPTRA
jgi:hypothetical protein